MPIIIIFSLGILPRAFADNSSVNSLESCAAYEDNMDAVENSLNSGLDESCLAAIEDAKDGCLSEAATTISQSVLKKFQNTVSKKSNANTGINEQSKKSKTEFEEARATFALKASTCQKQSYEIRESCSEASLKNRNRIKDISEQEKIDFEVLQSLPPDDGERPGIMAKIGELRAQKAAIQTESSRLEYIEESTNKAISDQGTCFRQAVEVLRDATKQAFLAQRSSGAQSDDVKFTVENDSDAEGGIKNGIKNVTQDVAASTGTGAMVHAVKQYFPTVAKYAENVNKLPTPIMGIVNGLQGDTWGALLGAVGTAAETWGPEVVVRSVSVGGAFLTVFLTPSDTSHCNQPSVLNDPITLKLSGCKLSTPGGVIANESAINAMGQKD